VALQIIPEQAMAGCSCDGQDPTHAAQEQATSSGATSNAPPGGDGRGEEVKGDKGKRARRRSEKPTGDKDFDDEGAWWLCSFPCLDSHLKVIAHDQYKDIKSMV